MRDVMIAACAGACVWSAALSVSFGATESAVDVSEGVHTVKDGESYTHAVARGAARLLFSGGTVTGFTLEALSPEHAAGSAYGHAEALAGVISTDTARVVIDAGDFTSVMSIGGSDLWFGPGAGALGAYAHESSTLTVQGGERAFGEIGAFGQSRILYRTGVTVGDLSARDSSEAIVTGGEIRGDLRAHESSYIEFYDGVVLSGLRAEGDARVEMLGGVVGRVVADSTQALIMHGGEAQNSVEVRSGARVHITGGVIGETLSVDFSGVGGEAVLDVRLAFYDHDGDPTTRKVELDFDESEEIVLDADDARFHDADDGVRELRGLRVRWEDDSESVFDVRAFTQDANAGRLVLRRSSIPEDLNHDGGIDVLDYALFLGEFGSEGGIADFNGDGMVDVLDLVRFLQAWQ